LLLHNFVGSSEERKKTPIASAYQTPLKHVMLATE